MPALASPSTWRTNPAFQEWYAYVLIPDIVLQCSHNNADIEYPVTVLNFDNVTVGAYTDVQEGMVVQIESSGGTLKGYAYIRSVTTPATLSIQPVGGGDLNLADNDIIKVLDLYHPHAKIPRIIVPDGTVYKNWEEGFVAASAQPPVANPGGWYAARLNGATEIEVDLDGTGSFPVADGADITDYAWDIVDGSVVSGDIDEDTLTVEFPDGYRWVSLTITDSNGNTHTARKLVVTTDSTTPINMGRLGGNLEEGWDCSLELLPTDVSDYPLGTAVIVWAEEQYGASAGSLNGVSGYEHIKFCGWTVDDVTVIEPFHSDYVINAKNIQSYAALITAFGQTTQYAASPANWWDVADHNAWRHIHNIVYWHSNLFEIAPVERPSWYADFPAVSLDADPGNLRDQLRFITNGVRARFTADRSGYCYFRFNPHLMTTAERTALETVVTLANTDWSERVSIPTLHRAPVGSLSGSGVVAHTTVITAKLSAAPGKMPGQGVAQESLDRQLIVDQTDLNRRTGRQYALLNIDTPQIPLTIFRMGMVADPAWQEWIKFTQAASTNRRGLEYSAQRFLLETLEVNVDFRNLTSTEQWTLSKTPIDGVANGVTVVVPGQDPPEEDEYIDTDGTWEEQLPYDWDTIFPTPYVPEVIEDDPSYVESTEAICWGSQNPEEGSLFYTEDFTLGMSTVWVEVLAITSAHVQQCMADKDSRSAVYVLFEGGLYYTADVATVTPTLLAAIPSGSARLMRMTSSGDLVIFGHTAGTSWVQLWDGTLGSQINVDTDIGEMAGDVDDYGLGLVVTPANFQLHFSTTYGGSFTQMSGLTGVNGTDEISVVRIPHKKASGAANNDLSAMEVIYSMHRASTHRVTYNFNTNAVVSTTDITYNDGTPLGVWGLPETSSGCITYGHGLETYAGNANRIVAGMVRGGHTPTVYSTDGGDNWTENGLNLAHFYHFVEPVRGGNGLKGWMISDNNGLRRTTDGFATTAQVAAPGFNLPTLPRGIFQL